MTKNSANSKFWSRSNPLCWGTVITLLFFAFLLYLGISPYCELTSSGVQNCQSKFNKFVSSSPNEIGDTLAGIAGALAFLWIIVTVLLQSQELTLQRQELERTRTTLEKQTSFLAYQNSLRLEEENDKEIRSKLKTLKGVLGETDFTEFIIETIAEPRKVSAVDFVTSKYLKANTSLPDMSKLFDRCHQQLRRIRLKGWRISKPWSPKRWQDAKDICIELLILAENASNAVKEEIINQEDIPSLKLSLEKVLHREIWSPLETTEEDFDI